MGRRQVTERANGKALQVCRPAILSQKVGSRKTSHDSVFESRGLGYRGRLSIPRNLIDDTSADGEALLAATPFRVDHD
jgi:hypothetical protein